MERKQQLINYPLTATKQQKLRVFYKNENGLRKNASEELVFDSLGIQNRKTYHLKTENNYQASAAEEYL